MIDRDRHDFRPAVAERGLKIDKTHDPGMSCRLDDVDRAVDIRCRVLAPILRVLVGRGAMDDVAGLETREDAFDERAVGDAALNQRQARDRGEHLAPAGLEIVDDQDLMPLRQIRLDKVRAETAAGPRYPESCP